MNFQNDLLSLYVSEGVLPLKDRPSILEKCELKHPAWESIASCIKVSPADLARPKSIYFSNIPYSSIRGLSPDPDVALLAKPTVKRMVGFSPIKIDKDTNTLIVATDNPANIYLDEAIRSFHLGPYALVLVDSSELAAFIDNTALEENTTKALSKFNEAEDIKTVDDDLTVYKISDEERSELSSGTVQVVNNILRKAVPYRASDIHIEPFETKAKIRYRVDGELIEDSFISKTKYGEFINRIKIMANLNSSVTRFPQDGKLVFEFRNKKYDVRVSTLPTIWGEKFVLRILDSSFSGLSRQELGLSEENNALIDSMLASPFGLILITGPTGCGKTTMLYSLMHEMYLNDPNKNYSTIEDPVEYTMDGINQTQIITNISEGDASGVNKKAKFDFARALRALMRQDPDVILVGEIRDNETADVAVQAALTGHLIFASIHTNDAVGVVTRLQDIGVQKYLIPQTLSGIISPRLVKKLCPYCKEGYISSKKEMEKLHLTSPRRLYKKNEKGCQYCNNTGYNGRIAVHEVIRCTRRFKRAIEQGASHDQLEKIAVEEGTMLISDTCSKLVLDGITDVANFDSINAEL